MKKNHYFLEADIEIQYMPLDSTFMPFLIVPITSSNFIDKSDF